MYEGLIITENKSNGLTEYEREYVDLYGNLFDMRGRNKVLGQIYAILTLRATSPDKGIDQQEIAKLINRSVSTVSRLLGKMVEMRHCGYTEAINESKRLERKYYAKPSFKELLLDRHEKTASETVFLKKEMEKLKKRIPNKDLASNKALLDQLERIVNHSSVMEEFNRRTLLLVEELFKDL